MPENTSASVPDIFAEPQISTLWMDVTEICDDDPTMAKAVIRHLAVELWNLPWPIWQELHRVAVQTP